MFNLPKSTGKERFWWSGSHRLSNCYRAMDSSSLVFRVHLCRICIADLEILVQKCFCSLEMLFKRKVQTVAHTGVSLPVSKVVHDSESLLAIFPLLCGMHLQDVHGRFFGLPTAMLQHLFLAL